MVGERSLLTWATRQVLSVAYPRSIQALGERPGPATRAGIGYGTVVAVGECPVGRRAQASERRVQQLKLRIDELGDGR